MLSRSRDQVFACQICDAKPTASAQLTETVAKMPGSQELEICWHMSFIVLQYFARDVSVV